MYGGAASDSVIAVDNAADVQQFILIGLYGNTNLAVTGAMAFPMPIVIPAGWKLRLRQNVGYGWGTIQGWEE